MSVGRFEIDPGGTAYLVWSDYWSRSRFIANDFVFSMSTTGTVWTVPVRITVGAPTSVRVGRQPIDAYVDIYATTKHIAEVIGSLRVEGVSV
ncbi:hypothetical protein ACIG5F_41705, partial [Kutzneria sp. NPDC052558]